ncbi:MAG: iron ABC transporter permease [Eubacterium sp.]
MKTIKHRQLVLLLSIILVFLMFIACSVGRYSVNPADIFYAIWTKITHVSDNHAMENIFFVIRLPRIFAAILIGSALSLCGAVYQGIFKNPLVSPDLLGVSSGACVGAALAILMGMGLFMRQIFAFGFGMLAMLMTITFPKLLRNRTNMILVLSGIITSGFMDALLGVIKFSSEDDTILSTIVFWQMGSLAQVKTPEILAFLPIFIMTTLLLICLSFRINILSFGDVEAQTLGINIKRLRGIIMITTSLLTASAICVSGTIGWIGLVIPHLARLLSGSDHTKTLPVTMLIGAIFLLTIDTIARTLTSLEIPLSILTGLVGAPFFAWLLYRQKARID